MDNLPFADRVKLGTQLEQQIANCLNKYHGWHLTKSTFDDDVENKIDYFEGLIPVQVKSRESGSDFLYDLYEPWGGCIEDSIPGRDHKSQFELYICLSRDRKWIRVADGKAMKKIIAEAEEEWIEKGCRFPIITGNGKRYWASEKHEGVQFWLHRDAKNRRLKVLCFVPESLFETLKKYEYREN